MNNALYTKLKAIIVEQLGVEESQITPEANFEKDLEADSLDMVETIMAIEEEFGILVPDDDAEGIETVEDLVKYIDSKK